MTSATELKRLYKSRTERMIDGVCGGVAKYFNVDPTLVRVAWVLMTLLGGAGILLYIVSMIIIPKEPYFIPQPQAADAQSSGSTSSFAKEPSKRNSLFWGILLIAVGMILFLHNMGFAFWRHWWWFDGGFFLSLLLILVGVAFLWGGRNYVSKESVAADPIPGGEASGEALPLPAIGYRRLYRSFSDSKLFGVCGGLAQYFGIDSAIVRILFLVGAFASGGAVAIGYVILAILVPKEIPTFKTV
jgi:phage shock protein C